MLDQSGIIHMSFLKISLAWQDCSSSHEEGADSYLDVAVLVVVNVLEDGFEGWHLSGRLQTLETLSRESKESDRLAAGTAGQWPEEKSLLHPPVSTGCDTYHRTLQEVTGNQSGAETDLHFLSWLQRKSFRKAWEPSGRQSEENSSGCIPITGIYCALLFCWDKVTLQLSWNFLCRPGQPPTEIHLPPKC